MVISVHDRLVGIALREGLGISLAVNVVLGAGVLREVGALRIMHCEKTAERDD